MLKVDFHKIMTSRKVLLSLVAIVVVLTAGAYWYFNNAVFSKGILNLQILGPASAKAGDEITYTVKYKNNGNFVLQNPQLIFQLPDNSLTEDSKMRFTQSLDDIYPGQENSIQFKGRILGQEGDVKMAHAWLTYTPRNLSAQYESDTTLSTTISEAPITFTYDLPSSVEKGKIINYSINYFSSIDYPLENLSVRVAPVNGFDITYSDPMSLDDIEWKVGTLNKGHGGRVTISGNVTSDTQSQLIFSAELGMWQNGVFVTIKKIDQDVQVAQPLLFVSQQINGSSNYAASFGDTLNYTVSFRNIGSTPFSNLFVVDRLQGDAYDLSTLSSTDGQVNQNDNLIVFDPNQVLQLKTLNPNQQVSVSFSIKLKDSLPQGANPVVINRVNVLDISQSFDTKISSKVSFSQKAYFQSTGGIENSGPIPPKVGQTTYYAIVWQVNNDVNDLKNIKVKAILPQNVYLVDNIYPQDQGVNFSFDNKSRQIVWSAGDLASGAMVRLTFQVALTPASYQVGNVASLMGSATVYGDDQFSGATVQNTAPAVNTSLPDDSLNSGGGFVGN